MENNTKKNSMSKYSLIILAVILTFNAINSMSGGSLALRSTQASKSSKELKTVDLDGNIRSFLIVYNDEYGGSADFYENSKKVFIYMTNLSKTVYDIKKISIRMFTINGAVYQLVVDDIFTGDSEKPEFINPNETVVINARIPTIGTIPKSEIKGFKLEAGEQPVIRFGYEKHEWLKRLWKEAKVIFNF